MTTSGNPFEEAEETEDSETTELKADKKPEGKNGLVWKARLCFITYFLTDLLQITIISHYVLFRQAKNEAGFARNTSLACQENEERDTNGRHLKDIQRQASLMVTKLNALELIPAVPISIVLGVWSDVTRRRLLLIWLPCLGNATYCILIVIEFMTNCGDWILYIGALTAGLCGGTTLYISGGVTLLADVVKKEDLTLNFTFIEAFISLGLGIGNIIAGYMIIHAGLMVTLWFMVALSLHALVANAFLLQNPLETIPMTKDSVKVHFEAVCDVCRCIIPGAYYITIYFITFLLYIFVHIGQERTNVLYLEMEPSCYTPVEIGWWLFMQGCAEGNVLSTTMHTPGEK